MNTQRGSVGHDLATDPGAMWALLAQAREAKAKASGSRRGKTAGRGKRRVSWAKSLVKSVHTHPRITSEDRPQDMMRFRTRESVEKWSVRIEKTVSREIRTALKRAPKKRMKIKALRRLVMDSISNNADELTQRMLKQPGQTFMKAVFELCMDANSERIHFVGKTAAWKK